ncbi:hypothetical protein DMUE_0217 [Dictyocoela muelleri]|nr:hypothetical protein DMUE_0217 [Dictyocoela muelleri]
MLFFIYSFLSDKTEEAYTLLFRRIVNSLCRTGFFLNLQQCKSIAIMQHIMIFNMFSEASENGFFFHFDQAIRRKLVDMEVKTLFNEDTYFKEPVLMIPFLALFLRHKSIKVGLL